MQEKLTLSKGMILEFKITENTEMDTSMGREDAFGISSPITNDSVFTPSSLGSMSGFIGSQPKFDTFSPSMEPMNIFQSHPRVAEKEAPIPSFGSSPSKGDSFTNQMASPFEYRGLFLEESPSKNAINLEKIAMGQDTRTTIMLRNIPNKVDQATLKDFIDETSRGMYNFLYLRIGRLWSLQSP